MSSALPSRKLTMLCQRQHRKILELLFRLTEPDRTPLDLKERRQVVRSLRQNLSRHLQLMKHAFFPPLRERLVDNEMLLTRIQRFDQAMLDLLPQIKSFLYQAEISPEQLSVQRAKALYRHLENLFEAERKELHTLFLRHVPLKLEERQLEIFRKRLMATIASPTPQPASTPARLTTVFPTPIPKMVPGQPATASQTPPPPPLTPVPVDLPSFDPEELDRQAITRPVRPGETFWSHPSSPSNSVVASGKMQVATS